MNKKDTVSNAVYTGRNFQTQHGTFYVHSITMGNGDTGDYNSKSEHQDKFVIGQEVDYTIEPNANPAYPAKIKPFNPMQQQGGFAPSVGGFKKPNNQISIERQKALDLAITYGGGSQVNLQGTLATAEAFYQWISEPEAPATTVATPQPGQPSHLQDAPMPNDQPPF